MEDEDAIPHPPGFHIVCDHVVGGAGLLLVGGHAEQLGGLVHHDEVFILVEDGEGEGVRPGGGGGEYGHLLAGGQGGVEPGGGHAVHRHQPPGQQGFHIVAALALYAGEQKGEQGGGLGHRVDGGVSPWAAVVMFHFVT